MTSQHCESQRQNEEKSQQDNRQLGELPHSLCPENAFSYTAECGTESAAFGGLDKHKHN